MPPGDDLLNDPLSGAGEGHLEGLAALETSRGRLEKEWGKMLQLIFDVRDAQTLTEIRKVAQFKKKAK